MEVFIGPKEFLSGEWQQALLSSSFQECTRQGQPNLLGWEQHCIRFDC